MIELLIALGILTIMGVTVLFTNIYIKRMQEGIMQELLREVAWNHLESKENGEEPTPMGVFIRKRYYKSQITPELLEYFEEHYPQSILEATKEIEQVKREDAELQKELDVLNKRQESQFNSLNTLKSITD